MLKNNITVKIICLCILVLLSSCNESPNNTLAETDIQQLNQAAGLMGQYQYDAAVKILSPIHLKYPNHATVTLDLAVAVLNRQQDNDIEDAIQLAALVLKQDAKNLRANYLLGILYLYQGQAKQALSALQFVVEIDSKDAHAEYFYAQALEQLGDFNKAYMHYSKAAEILPYLRSASYAAAMTARKLNWKQQAKAHLGTYQKLKNNPRALLAEYKYTRMGRLAEINPINDTHKTTNQYSLNPAKWIDQQIISLEQKPARNFAVIQSLFPKLTTELFLFNSDADIEVDNIINPEITLRPFPVLDVSQSALADINNDGLTDALVCSKGRWFLFLQDNQKQWNQAEIFPELELEKQIQCGASKLFDADHDGDIDIFIANYEGADELFSNNGNMTFRRLSEKWTDSNTEKTVQIIPVDWDHDRDLDILLLKQNGQLELLNNHLLWSYQRQSMELPNSGAINKILVLDKNADGILELITLENQVINLWEQSENSNWQPEIINQQAQGYENLLIEDFDGDGIQELVIFGTKGIRWQSLAKQQNHQQLSKNRIQQLQVIANPSSNGPVLLSLEGLNEKRVIKTYFEAANQPEFVHLQLVGADDSSNSLRSNYQAVGSEVRGRIGRHWIIPPTFTSNTQSGQNVVPKILSTLGSGQLDFVEIRWPDGVFQTELNISSGSKQISETQRQLSSCPVLFVETAEGYQFVSDILGVGGVGFFAEPGIYVEPRPWEYFMLPNNLIQPGSEKIRLKITEPMEENTYLDSIQMHRYRLPKEWQMVIDERMGVSKPFPSGKPLFYRNSYLPVKSEDGKGNDVSSYIKSIDNNPVPIGQLHSKYIGLVEHTQQLILHFPQIKAQNLDSKNLGLVVDGWVEYPYSQTVFAAWQEGKSYQAPTIEVLVNDKWQTLHYQIGYPAGMPRKSFYPLQGLPRGTTAIRLSSNLELYYDAIRLVEIETPASYQKHTAKLSRAKMEYIGFPERTNAASNRPVYNYHNRLPYSDMKTLTGDFTRYGEISELLFEEDNAFAIIGSGDSVAVEFKFDKDRNDKFNMTTENEFYVLEARGYAKDMDLYTETGGTVSPLPITSLDQSNASKNSENNKLKTNSEKLHDSYNTRYQDGW